ncbi:hypothetical protein ACFQZX_14090 [Mucilaginibacter litoreus]|uniref:Lipoprotein n=1 Tax=Mucilaginibacter litoreus TaxID=1048221 RepID=A0ABW3AUL9_9SPHI
MTFKNYFLTHRIIFLFAIILCFFSCDVDEGGKEKNTAKDSTGQFSLSEEKKWEYNTDVDEMTSEKKYSATLDSDDKLRLPYAFNHPVFPQIGIDKDGTRVWVAAPAIASHIYDGIFDSDDNEASIEAKFDDEKAITFKGYTPQGDDKYYIIINKSDFFISKLKKAKKLKVRATFVITEPAVVKSTEKPKFYTKYSRMRSTIREGRHSLKKEIMDFNVAGLKWD